MEDSSKLAPHDKTRLDLFLTDLSALLTRQALLSQPYNLNGRAELLRQDGCLPQAFTITVDEVEDLRSVSKNRATLPQSDHSEISFEKRRIVPSLMLREQRQRSSDTTST